MCYSTFGSTCARRRASIREARVRTSPGGGTRRPCPPRRRRQLSRPPGWLASDGDSRAELCGSRNTRPGRLGPTRSCFGGCCPPGGGQLEPGGCGFGAGHLSLRVVAARAAGRRVLRRCDDPKSAGLVLVFQIERAEAAVG